MHVCERERREKVVSIVSEDPEQTAQATFVCTAGKKSLIRIILLSRQRALPHNFFKK